MTTAADRAVGRGEGAFDRFGGLWPALARSAIRATTFLAAAAGLAAEGQPRGEDAVVPRRPVPSMPADGACTTPGALGIPGGLALGAGSCATGSCHGGPKAGNHDVQSFAATIWMNDDPHASAFQSLHSPRSRRMAALLGLPTAHEATTCLACHTVQASASDPLPPGVLADGVACGSCHGDATGWIALHTLPSWRSLPAAEKQRTGFRDLGDVTGRVRSCIPCHVGDETREVDHELVAAGHPRLSFEFAAYQRLSPRHWSPADALERAADFAERSWAVGQAETIAAAAHLLSVRARRAAGEEGQARDSTPERLPSWPEFAEFDCYACHRALSPDRLGIGSARRFRNPFPGTPGWQPWTASAGRLLSAVVEPPASADVATATDALVDTLRPQWAATDPERLEAITRRAEDLQRAAERTAREIDRRPRIALDGSSGRLDALVAGDPPDWRFWDAAVQSVLLVEAAREGGPARLGLWPVPARVTPVSETRRSFDALRRSLRFPEDAGGPDGFDPGAFQAELQRLP